MKPTFRVHFSTDPPDRPGLWLSRKANFISVLEVDKSDIERQERQGNWLDGEWGAHLQLVDRDLVPLDRTKVQEYLDKEITNANKDANEGSNCAKHVRYALQQVRLALTGSALELPQDALGQEEPRPVDETRPPDSGTANPSEAGDD